MNYPEMNTKRIKSFRQGQTVYAVTALGESSYIQQLNVTGKAFSRVSHIVITTVYHSLPANDTVSSGSFKRDMGIFGDTSLLDANVIPNKYNQHRLFTSRRKAASYLKLCKQLAYDVPKENDHMADLFFDFL